MGLINNVRCKIVGHQWKRQVKYELSNTSEGRLLSVISTDVCSCGKERLVLAAGRYLDPKEWRPEREDPYYSFEVLHGKEIEALASMDISMIRTFADAFAQNKDLKLEDIYEIKKKLDK